MQNPRSTFATFRWKHLKHKSETSETLENTAFARVPTACLVGNCGGAGLLFLSTAQGGWGRRRSASIGLPRHRRRPPLLPFRDGRGMGARNAGRGRVPHGKEQRGKGPTTRESCQSRRFMLGVGSGEERVSYYGTLWRQHRPGGAVQWGAVPGADRNEWTIG
jgi:hypothetical protein